MNEPSLNQIIEARNLCAKIVALYGERYLPIFERLENEIEARMKQQTLLDKAISICSGYSNSRSVQLTKLFNEEIV